MKSILLAAIATLAGALLLLGDSGAGAKKVPSRKAVPVVFLAAPDSLGALASGESAKVLPLGAIDAMSASLVRLTKIGSHYHATHAELVFVIEGTGSLMIGEDLLRVGPGAVAMVPAGTPHSFSADEGVEGLVLSVMTPPFDGADRVFMK